MEILIFFATILFCFIIGCFALYLEWRNAPKQKRARLKKERIKNKKAYDKLQLKLEKRTIKRLEKENKIIW